MRTEREKREREGEREREIHIEMIKEEGKKERHFILSKRRVRKNKTEVKCDGKLLEKMQQADNAWNNARNTKGKKRTHESIMTKEETTRPISSQTPFPPS